MPCVSWKPARFEVSYASGSVLLTRCVCSNFRNAVVWPSYCMKSRTAPMMRDLPSLGFLVVGIHGYRQSRYMYHSLLFSSKHHYIIKWAATYFLYILLDLIVYQSTLSKRINLVLKYILHENSLKKVMKIPNQAIIHTYLPFSLWIILPALYMIPGHHSIMWDHVSSLLL